MKKVTKTKVEKTEPRRKMTKGDEDKGDKGDEDDKGDKDDSSSSGSPSEDAEDGKPAGGKQRPRPDTGGRLTVRDRRKLKIEREQKDVKKTYDDLYSKYYSEVAPLIERLFGILDNELVRDKKFRYKGYFASGQKLHIRKAMTMKKTGDMDIWLKRIKPMKRSFKFSIVLDESGSMGGGKTQTSEDAPQGSCSSNGSVIQA